MDIVEAMVWLNDNEKDVCVKLTALFESDGWVQIVQPWAESREVEAGVRGANAHTWEDNRVAYGERSAYHAFQNLSEVMLQPFVQLALERQEEAEALKEEEYE